MVQGLESVRIGTLMFHFKGEAFSRLYQTACFTYTHILHKAGDDALRNLDQAERFHHEL